MWLCVGTYKGREKGVCVPLPSLLTADRSTLPPPSHPPNPTRKKNNRATAQNAIPGSSTWPFNEQELLSIFLGTCDGPPVGHMCMNVALVVLKEGNLNEIPISYQTHACLPLP